MTLKKAPMITILVPLGKTIAVVVRNGHLVGALLYVVGSGFPSESLSSFMGRRYNEELLRMILFNLLGPRVLHCIPNN